MLNFDLSPLFRTTVGFDNLMRLFDTAMEEEVGSYPPYNIVKTGEDNYRITMAVAGFEPEDLNIEVRDNTLWVTGRKRAPEQEVTYLHRGIAGRGFERRFELADYIRVEGASLNNGLLHIDLVREVPEALRPRKIAIAAGEASSPKRLIESSKQAA